MNTCGTVLLPVTSASAAETASASASESISTTLAWTLSLMKRLLTSVQ